MHRKLVLLGGIVLAVTFLAAADALALPNTFRNDQISAGNTIVFSAGPNLGTEGGEYNVDRVDPAANVVPASQTFVTFCVEMDEPLDFHTDGFIVDAVSTRAVEGGYEDPPGAFDELDARTAYMYTMFRKGLLVGYDDSTPAMGVVSADALQEAIYGVEDEIDYTSPTEPGALSPLSVSFIVQAETAIGLGEWEGLGSVRVLNLVWPDNPITTPDRIRALNDAGWNLSEKGGPAQDVLVIVPELSSLCLWGTVGGVFAIGCWFRRRKRIIN